jgi:antitoxin (DNA-binding transcriptional repressor) of toxin-antitoxin stability system
MNALGRWLLAIAALAPAGCGTLAAQEQPAVIAAPTERSRAELLRILSAAANGQPITLADDALTRASVVTLERRTPAGPQGRAATGRTLDAPEQFRLVLRGSRCLLVRQSDGSEWELKEAQCAPAAPEVQ